MTATSLSAQPEQSVLETSDLWSIERVPLAMFENRLGSFASLCDLHFTETGRYVRVRAHAHAHAHAHARRRKGTALYQVAVYEADTPCLSILHAPR
jgi:hypothetical protein